MGTLKFPLEAGVAIRGQIKREIIKGAWSYGLECNVTEDKGLLESLYFFTITGDDDALLAFRDALEDFMRKAKL